MSSTSEQKKAVERLYENEALIDNLIADVAKPVLAWAEQQLLAGSDAEAVFAAVRAVNESDAQDAATALATAQQMLTPSTAAASAPETSSSAPPEDQATKINPIPASHPVVGEQARPPAANLSQATAQVVAAAPTKPGEPPPPPANKTPTPATNHMPVATNTKPTNKPAPTTSSTQHQANRAFLRRLMGWFKPQNR